MSAPQPGQSLRVLYDFRAEEDGEMTVSTGTVLTIIGKGLLQRPVLPAWPLWLH